MWMPSDTRTAWPSVKGQMNFYYKTQRVSITILFKIFLFLSFVGRTDPVVKPHLYPVLEVHRTPNE